MAEEDFNNYISAVASLQHVDLKPLQTLSYSLLLLAEFVFASYTLRVQVKSRVSKFSSRVGLESESRTRVLQHYLQDPHLQQHGQKC